MVALVPVLPLCRFLGLVLLSLLLLLAPAGAQASLLHLEGPVPVDLGVQAGSLAPCASTAHCARANWSEDDPGAALVSLGHLLGEQESVAIQEQTPATSTPQPPAACSALWMISSSTPTRPAAGSRPARSRASATPTWG